MKSSKSQLANPPVIIIGAGRSGTNMLRDLLAQLPQFSTWPCDEINYIWRHSAKRIADLVNRQVHLVFKKDCHG